jgi:hydrogenase nickel incorporation protein HypB
MCVTCGCGQDGAAAPDGVRITALGAPPSPSGQGHHHEHPDHEHPGHEHPGHEHPGHEHPGVDTLVLEERVLARNDHLAEHVRAWLAVRRIAAVNLMSSPGSGKTSLLERTVARLAPVREVCVIEGDQETTFDAERIERAGARAVQVNTGSGCHLDAGMVERAVPALDPAAGSLLFVENVANLVCPALFDLGEQAKVVVVSVTEGDDKPLKYPHMFATGDLVVVNKTDLLPYVDFDVDALAARARSLNPHVEVLPLSVRTGDGMEHWYTWLSGLAAPVGPGKPLTPEGAVHGAPVGP